MTDRLSLKKLQSLKNQEFIADKLYVAESFVARFIGLIGKQHWNGSEGIWFPRCNSIHMWFMSLPIDVVFARKVAREDGRIGLKVISTHENVRPWKWLPVSEWKATETLELPVGTIRRHAIEVEDELCIS